MRRLSGKSPREMQGVSRIIKLSGKYAPPVWCRNASEVRQNYAVVIQPCPHVRKIFIECGFGRTFDAYRDRLPGRCHIATSSLVAENYGASQRGGRAGIYSEP
jgi:hypothetical protein